MNIVFFGTPDFAVPSLDILLKSEHKVLAVVTAPDKQRGRGKKISYTPVKEFALENNLPVLQPEKLKDPDFIEELKELNADLFVIVAFRILPKEVFSMPKFGSFNLHGSILPKYRGAAPIQWAIMNGDTKTGVTTFFLKEKVDTGNIIDFKEIDILPEDDLGTLHDKMMILGAELVLETVNKIEKNDYNLTEQDESLASPAPKITKETCKIDWNNDAVKIHNKVRGLSPFPGAFFILNEKIYKVYKTSIVKDKKLNPGEILQTKKEIFIGTKTDSLSIEIIQPEGRKRMKADEFLRGYSLIK